MLVKIMDRFGRTYEWNVSDPTVIDNVIDHMVDAIGEADTETV